jgi:DNA transformation protein
VLFRVDDASRAAFEALGAKPFVYDGKSKAVTVFSYYEVPEEIIYDDDQLRAWAVRSHRAAHAARLASRPKKSRRKSSRA